MPLLPKRGQLVKHLAELFDFLPVARPIALALELKSALVMLIGFLGEGLELGALRDSLGLGLASAAEVAKVLGHLVVHQGRIVVDDLDAARWLARTYLAADDASWANFREVGLYELTARAIRIAMELGVLSEADLWGSDLQAWQRMQAASQPELRAALALISAQTRFVWDEEDPSFRVSTKLRTIDPPVLLDGAPQPLSVLDADFAHLQAAYLERKSGKWPMRVIAPPVD